MKESKRGYISLEAGEDYTVALIEALEGAGWELREVCPGVSKCFVHIEFEKEVKNDD